jgi:hypothetical protein
VAAVDDDDDDDDKKHLRQSLCGELDDGDGEDGDFNAT